jgi:hypothetical protein
MVVLVGEAYCVEGEEVGSLEKEMKETVEVVTEMVVEETA